MQTADTYTAEIADLEKLAAELRTHGLKANLTIPEGRLPHLDVTNPRATILRERIYAQADSYWFSWAQRIAGCDETAEAASLLFRVLRTFGEETETH